MVLTTPQGTQIIALGDAAVVDCRLVVYDMAVYEVPGRVVRGPGLTEAAGEYLGQRARELGYDGVEFRGTRRGGAIGKRGSEMVKRYPRER